MKLGDWINRKRHNRGFGIQSPSSFFFITQVLREHLPYYAYPVLDKAVGGRRQNRKHFRELFRIANHHKPTNCISVGSAAGASTMILARPNATHYAITPAGMTADAELLLNQSKCRVIGTIEQFTALMNEVGTIGMLYIGTADTAGKLISEAVPHTNKNSIVVVDGINRSKAAQAQWQQIINDSATIITYDMYSYGVLLFDKERIKQHYTLKR